MYANWRGENLNSSTELREPGDIGIGATNYHKCLMVRCPICHGLHVVDIKGSTHPNPRWTWDQETWTLDASFKSTYPPTGHVCHWSLINAKFIIHEDSTANPEQDGGSF